MVAATTHNTVLKKLPSMSARLVVSSSATAFTLHRLALCTANPMTAAKKMAAVTRTMSTWFYVSESR